MQLIQIALIRWYFKGPGITVWLRCLGHLIESIIDIYMYTVLHGWKLNFVSTLHWANDFALAQDILRLAWASWRVLINTYIPGSISNERCVLFSMYRYFQ